MGTHTQKAKLALYSELLRLNETQVFSEKKDDKEENIIS